MASILTNSVGSPQVEGGPDLAEGHSTILMRMRMYREVDWVSSEGGSKSRNGESGVVRPQEYAKPLTKTWVSLGRWDHVKFQIHSSPLPPKTKQVFRPMC